MPYEFTNTLTTTQQVTYLDGLREWELAAHVQFVPHTNQPNWILFTYNTNFIDYVAGGSRSPQVITISSLSRAQVCHEMGHSFGFNHENIRTDAPNYILVLTNNITDEPSNIHWFIPDPTTVTNGNYDYESVMHLGWDFDSTNPGVLATQQPKPPYFPRYQFRMGNYCLSPGDRAALAYLYGPPAVPLTNIVTTTADVGPGSLRAAIYYATDHPGTTIKFNIPTSDPGYSNGVFNIHLTGMLPPLVTDGTVIDGSTQPGFTGKPLIFVDASQILPETFTSDTFLIYSANNQIKNISFSGFNWNGMTLIYADATNNTISGCWFGLDYSGTNAAPNAFQGILITAGASRNIIGGTNALERNVISGNAQYGVYLTDSNTMNNRIFGNYIGTDFSGSNAVPNGKSGVFIGNGASDCTVGGTNTGAQNILSGNAEYGVYLTGSTGNVVLGNYIGTDVSGSNAVANGKSGVNLSGGASGNTIGSTIPSARNILSANTEYGVYLTNTTDNVILGNYIGVNASGITALANQKSGIGFFGGTGNTIGGNVPGAGNVLSGNAEYGIEMGNPVVTGNWIQGNLIGPGAIGTNSPGSQQYGIGLLSGANANIIGGTGAGARNVISGNTSYGLYISDPGTSNNLVQGNYIGPDATGTNAMGDGGIGIGLLNNASGNLIGGTSAGAGNLISGNPGFSYGIAVIGANRNVIQGNLIGTDPTGTNALANGFANVAFWSGSSGNIVGDTSARAGNIIAFSGGYGVVVWDPGVDNSIRGNSIFGNNYLSLDLNGDGVTLNDPGDADTGPNDLQNFPVITNAFGYGGSTIVLGNLNSLAYQTFFLDFYGNPVADPSGHGQGQFYLGTISVTTDGSGNANFAFTNSATNDAGQYITATATSTGGDTSEFAADVLATNVPVASAQFIGPYQSRTNGFAFSLNLETNFTYRIQTTINLAPPITWADLTNFTATNSPFSFTDHSATNNRVRFYRVVSP